jgi:site-specific recombinase XerD
MLFGTALEEYRLSLRQQEKSERTIKGYLQDLKFFENWLQQVWNGPVYLDDVTFTDVNIITNLLSEMETAIFLQHPPLPSCQVLLDARTSLR